MRLGSWPLDQVMWGMRTAAPPELPSGMASPLLAAHADHGSESIPGSTPRTSVPAHCFDMAPESLGWSFFLSSVVMDRVTNSSHWFLFHHCLLVGAQAGC